MSLKSKLALRFLIAIVVTCEERLAKVLLVCVRCQPAAAYCDTRVWMPGLSLPNEASTASDCGIASYVEISPKSCHGVYTASVRRVYGESRLAGPSLSNSYSRLRILSA